MDILGIGFWELIIIFVVALMVFGPRRLPEYAAKAGKFVRDLRNMSQGLMSEWQREITVAARLEELDEMRKELELTRQELNQTQQQIGQQTKQDLDQAQKDASAIKKQVTATASNSPSTTQSTESGSTTTADITDDDVETTAQEDVVEEDAPSPDSKKQISTSPEQPQEDVASIESIPDAATEPESVEVNGRDTPSTETANSTETAPKPSKMPVDKETIND